MPVLIAIDGPVGSGKSTVAQAVAERLGLDHLETGTMYRAVAVAAIRRGIEPGPDTADTIARLAQEVSVDMGPPVTVDGIDSTAEMRSPEVNRAVSAVAAHAGVRAEMVRRQREWVLARGGGVVEGRDIGSVVFPAADLKVFLTASDEERARRRGGDEDAADVAARDRQDSDRAVSPLTVPDEAVVIDTTGRSIDDIVDEIVGQL